MYGWPFFKFFCIFAKIWYIYQIFWEERVRYDYLIRSVIVIRPGSDHLHHICRVNNLIFEGKVCRKSKGSEQEYVCIDPIRCGPFVKDIHSRNYPDICSFQGFKPIICCPKRMLIVQDMIVKKSNIANESTYTLLYSY